MERVPTLPNPRAMLAHAVPDLGPVTGVGVALCGMPVEKLALQPDLRWNDVDSGERCSHCSQQAPSG